MAAAKCLLVHSTVTGVRFGDPTMTETRPDPKIKGTGFTGAPAGRRQHQQHEVPAYLEKVPAQNPTPRQYANEGKGGNASF